MRLLDGIDWKWLDLQPTLSDERLEAYWEQHKQGMTALCQRHGGKQPWAYYRFDKDMSDPREHFDEYPWGSLVICVIL